MCTAFLRVQYVYVLLTWYRGRRREHANSQAICQLFNRFAELTAWFVQVDLHMMRLPMQGNRWELLSHGYIHVLAMLLRSGNTKSDEADDPEEVDWPSTEQTMAILASFQGFLTESQGGSMAYLVRYGTELVDLSGREVALSFQVAQVTNLIAAIVQWDTRTLRNLPAKFKQRTLDDCYRNVGQAYKFFRQASHALDTMIDKHVKDIMPETARVFIVSLSEILGSCLEIKAIVPPQDIAEYRPAHLPLSPRLMAEAVAYRWRFARFNRLIMSSQMQLRVIALSTMASDLLNIHKSFNAHGDERITYLKSIAEFLLSTGLVTYLLGPTCHPEITGESNHIIGFLLVTGTYTDDLANLMWHTISSTQDPRLSEALLRMTCRVSSLYQWDGWMSLCKEIHKVDASAFSPIMRDLSDKVLFHILCNLRNNPRHDVDITPYALCARLIQESSVFGSQSPIANPDLLGLATCKLSDLLSFGTPSQSDRDKLYADCLQDIQSRSKTSLGSICVLFLMLRQTGQLQCLAERHDLARILIEELERAIAAGRAAGFPAVLSGPHNVYRKDLLRRVLVELPHEITPELGRRLWDMLVGPGASSEEDRNTGWSLLSVAYQQHRHNLGEDPFLSAVLAEYLGELPSECFCNGALTFVHGIVAPLVNDVSSIVLDNEGEDVDGSGKTGKQHIEHLWRMVLTARPNTIENQAIHLLVDSVYMHSPSMRAFPPHRARKVHLCVVGRCLRQLSQAATKLRAMGDGDTMIRNGDTKSMVLVLSDEEVLEQQLLFTRSLAVLQQLHQTIKVSACFSVPDMSSLALDSCREVKGDSAELKYQAFDGNEQTNIEPLEIGQLNSVGSLLSLLREVTGYTDFRVYFRGQPFCPRGNDLVQSLAEVKVLKGLLLVQREPNTEDSPKQIGATPVETEILAHFDELWSFLDMDPSIAEQIFDFLVQLPPEKKILRVTASTEVSYIDIFPAGQPLKALYGVFALRNLLAPALEECTQAALQSKTAEESVSSESEGVLVRAMSLVVSVLSDRSVISTCSSPDLALRLEAGLLEIFLSMIQQPSLPSSVRLLLDAPLLDSLLAMMLPVGTRSCEPLPDTSINMTLLCLQAIIKTCSQSPQFWEAFRSDTTVQDLLSGLLLSDISEHIRKELAHLICAATISEDGSVYEDFMSFYWPLIINLLEPSVLQSERCLQLVEACTQMLKALWSSQSEILNRESALTHIGNLLLAYESSEVVTQPEKVDNVAHNLLKMVHYMVHSEEYRHVGGQHALCQPGFAMKMFWTHLFPSDDAYDVQQMPRLVLDSDSRKLVIEIVSTLVEPRREEHHELINSLNDLVPYRDGHDDNDSYAYELPLHFERTKFIRSPSGYVGLRNLSNTCYLNSLVTQLFMNVEFRQFMLRAPVRRNDHSQALLVETQKLFWYMQQSIRRFYDPDDFVANIKTAFDGPIDIHTQMDVDEFYNLLFDQWESQMRNEQARNQLRSFYGGQLVQQVASKECDHISERLEPFSAIQCDIKGKKSLTESLQAYVDGEIMEGDNKYKCSSCDRHVDAVKRACLKDIPDNMIFHLKRFDFSLKTGERSKINDYFSFPGKIDLHPYTFDALASSTSRPLASGEDSEPRKQDIFELVGVLVHSGTAESGHYYSYVRERGTATSESRQTWVEFNDDNVSIWDPSQMEDHCFGGRNYSQQFDNGNVYDKSYSAYILFYQRSSSLQKEQTLAKESDWQQPVLSGEMVEEVHKDNVTLLRRHCLFDPTHIYLVNKALGIVKGDHDDEPDYHPADVGDTAINMALCHLDQVASRARETPGFASLMSHVDSLAGQCVQCSIDVVSFFDQRYGAFRALLQRHPDSTVRRSVGDLTVRAVRLIKEDAPDTYRPARYWGQKLPRIGGPLLHRVMSMMGRLFDTVHSSLRSWPEVFGLMLSIVQIGPVELLAFLHYPYFGTLLAMIQADSNMAGLSPTLSRMVQAVMRRMAKAQPPAYDNIIALIDVLLQQLDLPERGTPELPDHRLWGEKLVGEDDLVNGKRYYMTRFEHNFLVKEWDSEPKGQIIFLEKLILLNQNLQATESIIKTYMSYGPRYEELLLRTLAANITGTSSNSQLPLLQNAPYLHIAGHVFCRLASEPALIRHLINHVLEQTLKIENGEGAAFLEFHVTVFDGPWKNTRISRREVLMLGLSNLKIWVPAMLAYNDPAVGQEVQAFLDERLFKSLNMPDTDDLDNDVAKLLIEAARGLGCRCLFYLKQYYASRRISLRPPLLSAFTDVIEKCSAYFDPEDKSDAAVAFFTMYRSKSLSPTSDP